MWWIGVKPAGAKVGIAFNTQGSPTGNVSREAVVLRYDY
jgi:hypothetical protein